MNQPTPRQSAGPLPAEIMIIGDFPTLWESKKGEPFLGRSGEILGKLVQQQGWILNGTFRVYACPFVPPNDKHNQPDIDEWVKSRKTSPGEGWVQWQGKWISPEVNAGRTQLEALVKEVNPKLIITCGSLPLFLLTGNDGAIKWRGSRLSVPGVSCPIVPTLNPLSASKQEELYPILAADFTRAKNVYEGRQLPRRYDFLIAPTFEEAKTALLNLLSRADAASPENPLLLSGDLETRLGHIACFGIGESAEKAICIPFLKTRQLSLPHEQHGPPTEWDYLPFYWTEEEETELVWLIQQLTQHTHVKWLGQNYLYDCQYYHRYWGVEPGKVFDTMIGHHSAYSNTRKGLDFLSSIYSQDHIYWKDESKNWDVDLGEKQLWTYNCKDCCITWEIYTPILGVHAEQMNPGNVWSKTNNEHHLFQQQLFFPVLRMMNRGIRLDTTQRTRLRQELLAASFDRQEKLDQMAGHHLNPRSSVQLIKFFYNDLGLPVIKALKGESITTNSPAMAQIAEREPALHTLCQTIVELRSIGVFLSTFIDAELDSDQRMRCSFAIAGPTTFRFSSSENAFGSGMNLQNIPVEEKQKIKSEDYIKLPNIRRLFIPDPGYMFFDMDLDRADLQVVVWEADDKLLKLALQQGIDLHCLNACTIFDIKGIPFDELTETHPNYVEHRGKIGKKNRDKAKMGVHATNYGVGDRKLAQSLGITVAEAAKFRARWFAAHPGIAKWHARTETSVMRQGYVENHFGARLYKLGRFDLPEFLAWLPQSTVAGVINRALVNIDAASQRGETSTQLLIQVHDSLAGQFRADRKEEEIALLTKLARVPIPFADELVIPVGFKTSKVSWGDCK